MKYLLICSGLFLAIHSFGKDNQAVSLFDQLVDVNKFWNDHQDLVLPRSSIVFANDRELIRVHLQLVESTLREKNTDHLTSRQTVNRSNALDILHAYWQKGVFPQNIYHQVRTPYFIDHVNTACAVGHLIIETGFEALAREIALKDNYSLIENLDYPELVAWAHAFGFEIAELQWIQPLYYDCEKTCPPHTVQQISCHALHDGCIGMPDLSGGNPGDLYVYDGIYKFDSLTEEWIQKQDRCNLSAGYYKISFWNQDGDPTVFFYDILDPAPISVHAVENDVNDCTGSIEVNVSGGVGPYSYSWSNDDTGDLISNLCPGKYWLQVTDANNCVVIKEYDIGNLSGTDGGKFYKVEVYPNPVVDKLIVETSENPDVPGEVQIYNLQGVEILSQPKTTPTTEMNVSPLGDGFYFLKVSDGLNNQMRRFVKMGK